MQPCELITIPSPVLPTVDSNACSSLLLLLLQLLPLLLLLVLRRA
jgi:hypothetical protein